MTSNNIAAPNSTGGYPAQPGGEMVTIESAPMGNYRLHAETTEGWAVRLLKRGMSQRSVASETGLSRRKVGQIADRLQQPQDDIFVTRPARRSVLKDDVYQDIHAMACRPCGVKRSELSKQLAALYGFRFDNETAKRTLNMTKDQYQYLKKK